MHPSIMVVIPAKRTLDTVEADHPPPPKRHRAVSFTSHLGSTIMNQMRILHSEGNYHYLSENTLQVFHSWGSNEPFHFLMKSDDRDQRAEYLDTLLATLLKPETLVQTLELLQAISEQKYSGIRSEPSVATMVPSFEHNSGSEILTADYDPLPALLQAAKRANIYVETFNTAVSQARLRLILAYITLHLTLEFGVAARLQRDNPTWNSKQVKSEKWIVFWAELGREEGLGCKLQRLKDNVGYGKALWTWVEDCGIVWLPVLASMERGIIRFLKDNPVKNRHSEIIGTKLSTQDSWVSFSQAFSGIVINLLFCSTSKQYSMEDLFKLYVLQGSNTQTSRAFQDALSTTGHGQTLYDIEGSIPQVVTLKELTSASLLEIFGIELKFNPKVRLASLTSIKVNLVVWPFNAHPRDVIEFKTQRGEHSPINHVDIRQLACLFSPVPITKQVASFLCQLWDIGGVNGWTCISIDEGEELLAMTEVDSVREALQILFHCETSFEHIKYLVIPVETSETYFVYLCSLDEQTICLYHWSLADTDNSINPLKEALNVSKFSINY